MVKHCYQGKHLNNHPLRPQSECNYSIAQVAGYFPETCHQLFPLRPLLLAFALSIDELFIHLFALILLFTLDLIPSTFCRLYFLNISNKERRWALNGPIYWQFFFSEQGWMSLPIYNARLRGWVEGRRLNSSWLCYPTLSKAMFWETLFLWLGYAAPSPMWTLRI